MNALTSKLQITVAAAAVAAGTALSPAVASAAPVDVHVPAAPVAQVVGELPQAPGDFMWFMQVTSLQTIGSIVRSRVANLDSRAQRLEAYAVLNPDSFFGRWAAASAERLRERAASYGQLSFSACRGGTGISVGPYGTVTAGPC